MTNVEGDLENAAYMRADAAGVVLNNTRNNQLAFLQTAYAKPVYYFRSLNREQPRLARNAKGCWNIAQQPFCM